MTKTKTRRTPVPTPVSSEVEQIQINQNLAADAAEMLAAVAQEGIVLKPWMTTALEDETAIMGMRSDKDRTQVRAAIGIARGLVTAERDRAELVEFVERASEAIEGGWRYVIHGWVLDELEAVKYLDEQKLNLRVQPAGARKTLASALSIFFTRMLEELKLKDHKKWSETEREFIDELEAGVNSLKAIIDRCTAAIKAKKAKAEAAKAEETDKVDTPTQVEQ